MKKLKLFYFINILFRLLLIFLITFVWCNFYIKNRWLAIALSLLITIAVDIIIKYISDKKNYKLDVKQKEAKAIEQYANAFIFNDTSYSVDFFFKLAKEKHQAYKTSKFIVVKNPASKIILFPLFSYRELSTDDFIYAFNKARNIAPTKIIIVTSSYTAETQKLASKMEIKTILLDKSQTYFSLLKPYEMYPDKLINFNPEEKFSTKQMLAFAFSRNKTKAYFFSSVLLLLSSFLVRANIYFIIMSSVLLLFSLVSFIRPKFIKMPENNLLG